MSMFEDYREYTAGFEDPFWEGLENKHERKHSFVDLVSDHFGFPDVIFTQVPGLDQMPLHLEAVVDFSCSESDTDCMLALDALMPEEVNPPPPSRASRKSHTLPPVRPRTNMVGLLTIEQRQLKVAKYKQKRRNRSFVKRISYECRKKVADKRLRIKGRFVTKEQAVALLGEDHELLKQYFSSDN